MELNEIAKAWIERWSTELESPERKKYDWVEELENDAVYENPDLAIDLVLEILKQPVSNKVREVLAAGPLEQVLANHGSRVIERVEILAKTNPEFAHLLGGVWKNAMPDEVWERVQRVWVRKGWDGN